MNKILVASLFLLVAFLSSNAQKGPLNGSGNIISKTYAYNDFDKISLADLSGKVDIEAGKPFMVAIDIDDNLLSLLSVSVNNGKLVVELAGNRNNRLYIENTNIKIKISLPVIAELEHRGNNQVTVNGIAGHRFQLDKSGNGDVLLNGTVDELVIKKSGNGRVKALNLPAKEVTVSSSGNGDVIVNAENIFTVQASGNGDISNKGPALASSGSSRSGNARIIDSGYVPGEAPYPAEKENQRVKTRIKNSTAENIELKVVYPVKGSYGIDIKAGVIRREYFPPGTKIYRDGKRNELLFEITPENRHAVLVIE